MIPARLNVVTLGFRDLPRLRDFYSALGWEPAIEADDFCAFQLGGVFLGLFPWGKLAADGQARAAARVDGMRGFSLGINVERPEQVDEIIAAVETPRRAKAPPKASAADPSSRWRPPIDRIAY
jgi:uncharacterized protein